MYSRCPAPLARTEQGCDAPRDVVAVPAATITVGPSDWEAEGRVAPRTAQVGAFAMDRFEVTEGQLHASSDPARAAAGVTLEEARAFCKSRGGRLPTEDEWLAAAGPRRYPWGDTGAVCRRAAWGLGSGPCAIGADGPDTVGAHPDGVSPLGIHDLAGNVAEWVEPGIVKGGSWKSALATELRTWSRRESIPDARDPTIGFRCAY
jgi:formylglycine-generating enzyme required for sulfatase activity